MLKKLKNMPKWQRVLIAISTPIIILFTIYMLFLPLNYKQFLFGTIEYKSYPITLGYKGAISKVELDVKKDSKYGFDLGIAIKENLEDESVNYYKEINDFMGGVKGGTNIPIRFSIYKIENDKRVLINDGTYNTEGAYAGNSWRLVRGIHHKTIKLQKGKYIILVENLDEIDFLKNRANELVTKRYKEYMGVVK